LLPPPPRPPYGGRYRTISDRACLAAIVYMARTSTLWRLLAARELGCGSPTTRWRRVTEWANAGVFDQLHLQVRWDRDAGRWFAFVLLACAVVCFNRL
jgi:transposase